MTAKFALAVPVLQVADVGRSIAWYSEVLGFAGWGFPRSPPHAFALLSRDGVELMFQRAVDVDATSPRTGMAAYIRVSGGELLDLAVTVGRATRLARGPERMPYGDVELAITDPDGHVIILSEQLPADTDVPSARESGSKA